MVRTSDLKLKIARVTRILSLVSMVFTIVSVLLVSLLVYLLLNGFYIEYAILNIIVLSFSTLIVYRIKTCMKIQKLLEELAHSMDCSVNEGAKINTAIKLIAAIYTLYPKYRTYIC